MKNMKKKLATWVAILLVASLVMPIIITATPWDNVPYRIEDDQTYVALRAAAYAHGWDVVWHSETREVTLVNQVGFTETFPLADFVAMTGGFVQSGVTWIPMELAQAIFNAINGVYRLSEEARAIALADFDFLVDFILENSPWDSMISRTHDFDFAFIMEFYRELLYNAEPLYWSLPDIETYEWYRENIVRYFDGGTPLDEAANFLFQILADLSGFLGGVGHLGLRTLDVYTMQAIGITRGLADMEAWGFTSYTLEHLAAAFLHPQAVWFYGEVDASGNDSPIPAVPGNIETFTLNEAGYPSVAYISIHTFLADMAYDDAIILPFLQSVADYDHLIIDIRGNGGGLMFYPIDLLLRRLINEPTEFGSFEFFRGGQSAMAMMEASLADAMVEVYEPMYAELMYARIESAADFVAERGMALFNADDLARLDYVMVSRSLIFPCVDAVGFTGQIWLLVDDWSASASAMLTDMMQSVGMAIVVGTNTSHVMGTSHIYVALPNTGIVWRTDIGYTTDAYGRSLEFYGITPDVFNTVGLDALDTVLMIIFGQVEA